VRPLPAGPPLLAGQRTERPAGPDTGPERWPDRGERQHGSAVGITPSGRPTAKGRLVRRGASPVFGVTPQAGGHGLLFVNGGVSALDLPSPDACHGPAASRRGRAGSAL